MPAAELLGDRRLYLCTPDRPDLEDFVDRCIRGGVDIVQLREKRPDVGARQILERSEVVQAVCRDHGVPFILNDRPDLAVELDADGVHVGQDDAPATLARRLLGPDKIVGLSTHAPHELDAGNAEPVDYISAGPVNPTPTKPGRKGTGVEYLSYAAANSTKPFFVTGGATPETIPAMKRTGATRFVVVRYLTESRDPETAAKELTEAIYS